MADGASRHGGNDTLSVGRRSGWFEEHLDLFGRERSGKQETLPHVALLGLELGQLARLLNPFGKRFEMECFSQLHQGVDEGVSLRGFRHARDKRPVDLQGIDRELLEV